MALDPLAERLTELLAEGSIVASGLTPPMRERLVLLFRIGTLVEVKAGGGKRVLLKDAPALENWITSHYPSGLNGTATSLPPRAESLANFAHSKRGRPLGIRPVFMRGFGAAELRRSDATMPIGDLSRRYGIVAVIFDPQDPWRLEGTLALVENLELFLNVERIVRGIDGALLTAGRFDGGLIDLIARMPAVRVVHLGDFDPVGLDEYLRVREALGPRATLFVPERLAEYVARFGRADLLTDSSAVLQRVRRSSDASVGRVIAELDAQGKGLEQEALLIDLGDP